MSSRIEFLKILSPENQSLSVKKNKTRIFRLENNQIRNLLKIPLNTNDLPKTSSNRLNLNPQKNYIQIEPQTPYPKLGKELCRFKYTY